jgi:hypothetical protein
MLIAYTLDPILHRGQEVKPEGFWEIFGGKVVGTSRPPGSPAGPAQPALGGVGPCWRKSRGPQDEPAARPPGSTGLPRGGSGASESFSKSERSLPSPELGVSSERLPID